MEKNSQAIGSWVWCVERLKTGNKKRQTPDKILLIPEALDFSVTGFNKLPFFFFSL